MSPAAASPERSRTTPATRVTTAATPKTVADLAVLDPGITTATVTRNHGFMIFDTLYGLNAVGEPVPEMVEGHEVAEDGRSWMLRLRGGLRFHDGEPVLASDAVASLRRWARRDPFGKTLMAATDELSAPDDVAPEVVDLKPRDLMEARLVAEGHTGAEIANRLGVSLRTIEATRARLRRLLGLRTRADLVRFVHDHELGRR